MESFLIAGGTIFLVVLAFESFLSLLLTTFPLLGSFGKSLSAYCCRAPGLDIVLSLLIWVPWVISSIAAGWAGFIGCLLGQILAMQFWIVCHESFHAKYRQGPRINAYLNQHFGWWRNQLALWITAIVVPVFFLIRFAQILVYPFLVSILGFKVYNHREWINVSRQKFEGLIGADLIWCLYCDWMTGVYSLGAEMLRNVESFWCPIRFYYDKKCENCSIDFPDINGGWVAADGNMEQVVETLQGQLSRRSIWSWFGDPDRDLSPADQSSHEDRAE